MSVSQQPCGTLFLFLSTKKIYPDYLSRSLFHHDLLLERKARPLTHITRNVLNMVSQ